MPYTKLRFHFVFATKNRRRIITPEVETVLYPAIREAIYRSGGHPIEVNGDRDHTHIFTALKPSISCSSFIGKVKCNSSRKVREQFPLLKFKWQTGFGCFTVCPFNDDEVIQYIRNQKEHHARGTIREEWERILNPDDGNVM